MARAHKEDQFFFADDNDDDDDDDDDDGIEDGVTMPFISGYNCDCAV